MYRIQIKEDGRERYWTGKVPMTFDDRNPPLSFSSWTVARKCFKDHLPLFARYIELSDHTITDIRIVKVIDEKVVEERDFF